MVGFAHYYCFFLVFVLLITDCNSPKTEFCRYREEDLREGCENGAARIIGVAPCGYCNNTELYRCGKCVPLSDGIEICCSSHTYTRAYDPCPIEQCDGYGTHGEIGKCGEPNSTINSTTPGNNLTDIVTNLTSVEGSDNNGSFVNLSTADGTLNATDDLAPTNVTIMNSENNVTSHNTSNETPTKKSYEGIKWWHVLIGIGVAIVVLVAVISLAVYCKKNRKEKYGSVSQSENNNISASETSVV